MLETSNCTRLICTALPAAKEGLELSNQSTLHMSLNLKQTLYTAVKMHRP